MVRVRFRRRFDDDGRVLGVEIDLIATPASRPTCRAVMTRAICHFDNAYWLPHVRCTLLRANQHAEQYGLSRFAGRRVRSDRIHPRQHRASARQGSVDVRPSTTTARRTITSRRTPDGRGQHHRTADRAAAGHQWLPRAPREMRPGCTSPVLKRGLALTPVKFGISFTSRTSTSRRAWCTSMRWIGTGQPRRHRDGPGLNTKVAQVVAHELAIDFDAVRVTATDTQKVANTSATRLHRRRLERQAAQDAARRSRAAGAFAPSGTAGGRDVRFANGRVSVAGKELAFAELVRQPTWRGCNFGATASTPRPPALGSRETARQPFFYFAYGAAASEVVIDTLTGEFRLLRADVLHDVGTSLNRRSTSARSKARSSRAWAG